MRRRKWDSIREIGWEKRREFFWSCPIFLSLFNFCHILPGIEGEIVLKLIFSYLKDHKHFISQMKLFIRVAQSWCSVYVSSCLQVIYFCLLNLPQSTVSLIVIHYLHGHVLPWYIIYSRRVILPQHELELIKW